MQERLVNKHEGVEIFYDEVCRENEEEGEWSIPSQIRGLFQFRWLGEK